MAVAEEQILIVDEWRGLYSESWKGVIVDDAFAHPAKFSRALIRKIYDHVIAEGWATKGDSVVDPFGGVALGSFDAMRHGLNWFGCELEQKFVELGGNNIAVWNERYSLMPNWGAARLLQGDSRRLSDVMREASCCVSSPPYIEPCGHGGGKGSIKREKSINEPQYGHSPGQIAEMPEGDLGLVISSPPYANDTVNERNGIDLSLIKKPGGHNSQSRTMAGYGEASGQLGAMKEGDHSIAITSPPYIESLKPETEEQTRRKQERIARSKTLYDGRKLEKPSPGKAGLGGGYGITEGNVAAMPEGQLCVTSPPFESSVGTSDKFIPLATPGNPRYKNRHYERVTQTSQRGSYREASAENLGTQQGETFWSASRLILEQLHQVLTPNAHAVFVVKAFVRDKKIVDFPAQWAQVCEAVGFKLLHDHHALLTEHYGTQGGFDEDTKLTVERKSFFRRLAEQKGSPRIDYENVLCFRKVP